MTRVIIPVYFDYASTLCYIAWRIVSDLERELEIDPLWKGVPISLRDFKASSGRGLGPRELEKIAMVSAETGVPVTPPAAWLDSDAALQGAELAREANAFPAYHSGVFQAAFHQRCDIGDRELLADIAQGAGMNRARFLDDLASERMAARIAENKREADRMSALGYPTFILGDFPLIGIQPIDTMRLLFQRYIQQRRDDPGN
jgi:predicted DsbA family dithiol-disulfide isomerase